MKPGEGGETITHYTLSHYRPPSEVSDEDGGTAAELVRLRREIVEMGQTIVKLSSQVQEMNVGRSVTRSPPADRRPVLQQTCCTIC